MPFSGWETSAIVRLETFVGPKVGRLTPHFPPSFLLPLKDRPQILV